ncbi:MAG: DUF6717 family protein [Planctomycetota bacterium]
MNRAVPAVLAALLLAGCGKTVPPPGIVALQPYKFAGNWVFDDSKTGLSREAFVGGTPEIIEDMTKGIPGAEKGFCLLFSAQPFPGSTHKLVWRRGDRKGNWYYCEQTKAEGWLCAALFRYFPAAPKEIHAAAKKR